DCEQHVAVAGARLNAASLVPVAHGKRIPGATVLNAPANVRQAACALVTAVDDEVLKHHGFTATLEALSYSLFEIDLQRLGHVALEREQHVTRRKNENAFNGLFLNG